MSGARARRLALWLGVWAAMAGVAFAWQWAAGVYRSEFGAHPDEAAHYVTGLMVRDYLAGGVPGSPMAFAADYYRHYPKIGLGAWPPLFYVVQAAATVPFGGGPEVVLGLMAALAGGLGASVAWGVKRVAGWPCGLLAGGALLGLPLVQTSYGMVMAETLVALMFFGAAAAFGRYLEEGRARDALWFGLFAALAILSKGTGMALALVPPLAAFLAGKPGALLRWPTWAGAAVVCVLAGPWMLMTHAMGRGGWLYPYLTWEFSSRAIGYYAFKFAASGWPLLAGGAVCVAARLIASRRLPGREAAWVATAVAVYLFQTVMPVGLEARHLVSAFPCLAALAFCGGRALAGMAFPPTERAGALALAWGGALAVALAALVIRPTEKAWGGFAGPAAELLARSGPEEEMLVSSDASGEGMFIAAVAAGDRRPGRSVQRSSKLLSASDWSGAGYRAHFADAAAVRECLAASRFRFVVTDGSVPERKRRAHHGLLEEALREGGLYREISSGPAVRGGVAWPGAVRVYERAAP